MSLSYWEKTTFLSDSDYIIIGAGIVGLFAALEIKRTQKGARIVVLERSFLPTGASTKNAGFACFGSVSELIQQLNKSSETELIEVVNKRWKGLLKLKQELGEQAIDFEGVGGYEMFRPEEEEVYETCIQKIEYFNELFQSIIQPKKKNAVYQNADHQIKNFGFKNVQHLIFNQFEGQLNSGKMMKVLIDKVRAEGISIYFGTEVLSFEKKEGMVKVQGKEFELNGNKLIITTNAFAKSLLPQIQLVPGRGQVLITKPIKNILFNSTFHYDKGYFYFRKVNDRVLIGGGRNLFLKQEETTEFETTSNIQIILTKLLKEVVLPNTKFEVDYSWSGIMAFGDELKPVIEKVEDQIYCAVRCNGMGVAIGSEVGAEVAQLAIAE